MELDQLYSPEFKNQFQTLSTGLDKMYKDLLEVGTGLDKVNTGLKSVEKTRVGLNKQQKDAEALKQQQIKTNSDLIKQESLMQKAISDEEAAIAKKIKREQEEEKLKRQKLDTSIKQTKETERLTKEAIKHQKVLEKENSAYQKLNKQYVTAVKKAKDLGAAYGVSSRGAKQASRDALKLQKRLAGIDKSVGQFHRGVGGYFKSMIKGAAALGASYLGVQALFRLIGSSVKTIANFEKAMDKVAAVAGASDSEFKSLIASAKTLGSTTSKTASEVSGLQLEFAKLGFSTAEILAATEATISLSIAAGSDLAESAVVAASTVRGFGLAASDTQMVVDVMAKSFSSSALDLSKFKTAMGAVAPVAKAAGKDIQFTTAQLSVLTDNGIDASTAGTSLRNMFLDLAKKGLTWEEGLEKINKSTDKNVTALELFGKRGATTALILADNIEKAEGLEEAYNGAAGAAEEMARIMEDNLIGDVDKLGSAWEGFVLSLNQGEGQITKVFRTIVQWVTRLIDKLIFLNSTAKKIFADMASDNLKELRKTNAEQIKAIQDKADEEIAIIENSVERGRRSREAGDILIKKINDETTEHIKNNFKSLLDYEIEGAKSTVANIEKQAETWKLLGEAMGYSEEKQQKFIKLKSGMLSKESRLVQQSLILYREAQANIEAYNMELLNLEMQALESAESIETMNEAVDGGDEVVNKWAKNIEKVTGKTSELNSAWQKVIETYGVDMAIKIKENSGALEKAHEEGTKSLTDSLQERYEANKEYLAKIKQDELDAAAERKEMWKAVGEATIQTGIEIANALFEINQSGIELEGQQLEAKYAQEQTMAGDNLAAQRAADRKYAREKAILDRKQAQSEKDQALFNIAINAAVGFTKALAQSGVFGVVLGALVLASAAVQAIAVSSQPLPALPAYDKGTESAPSGFIQVAEKRPEIIKERGKKAYLQRTPLITDKLTGAKITGGAETEQILNHGGIAGYDDQTQFMNHKFNKMTDAINGMKIEFGYNKQGDPYVQRNERDKITYAGYYG